MAATWALADSWLEPIDHSDHQPYSPDEIVLRYLAAYGPSTSADVRAWSGMTGVREVIERLRPQLRAFRDESGRELFDLPDAPRPEPAVPAPPRFLPEYDNVVLAHADRTRIVDVDRAVPMPAGSGGVMGSFLVDGFFRGMWRLTRTSAAATLRIEPFRRLPEGDLDALTAEGEVLVAFLAKEAAWREVRVHRA